MTKSKIRKIDLFYNFKSQFGVLGQFTEALHEALKNANIRSTIIDIRKMAPQDLYSYFEKEKPDYTAGFNFTMTPGSFLDPLQIPHAALIVDCPSHHIHTLNNKNQIASFIDQTSLDFMQKMGYPRGFWFPHAIEKDAVKDEDIKNLNDQKRIYDVVFCGSFIDHIKILKRWKKELSSKTVRLLEDCIEEILTNSQKEFLPECVLLFQNNPDLLEELKKKQIDIYDLLNDCELYLRGKDRVQMLSQIKEADVHFFGSEEDIISWQQVNKKAKNWHFYPAVEFSNLSSIFSQSRIVLNSVPPIRRGYHERLFRAIADGASCITGYNLICKETFVQKLGVITSCGYPWHDINETISYLLEDEGERLNCVFKERKLIQKDHTWDVRAKKLIEELSYTL